MAELLRVEALSAGYGEARVLDGVSLAVAEGQVLALLGRNGAGKTTLIATLMAATRRHGGRVVLAGRDVTALPSEARARAGLGWVPQERDVFRSLTVQENLTAVARPGPWDLARVEALFPRLAERRRNLGGQLSGGEQQMLAMGRALMTNPRLLLLDEPLEGLAPVVAAGLLDAIRRLTRDDGMAAILVEQHARRILPLADAAVVLERGRVAHAGPATALLADAALAGRLLGLGGQEPVRASGGDSRPRPAVGTPPPPAR